MGPRSIVISHLPLITFSESGLLLDARGLRAAWRDWGGPRCFWHHQAHTHTRDPCAKKSTWWVITVTVPTESRFRAFSGSPLAFRKVYGSARRWPGCSRGELAALHSVRGDSPDVLPVLVTVCAMVSLTVIRGPWALEVWASKQNLQRDFTCWNLPCSSFMWKNYLGNYVITLI